jgi:glycosyltransferase involved in cell wall biosynthesis
MKILSITDDTTLFDEKSASYKNLLKASELVEQIHVVVQCFKHQGLKMQNIKNKIFLYPTNSRSRWTMVLDAATLAERQAVIASQLTTDFIEAANPYEAGVAAYLLSKRYKKNLLVNVFQSVESVTLEKSRFSAWFMRQMANYVLSRVHFVRVPSQLVGEAVCAERPHLETRIYILPLPKNEDSIAEAASLGEDLHAKYPQFNVIALSVLEVGDKQTVESLLAVAGHLRARYARFGLVIIDLVRSYNKRVRGIKKLELPYVAWEEGAASLQSYYKVANFFIDTSRDTKPGGPMTEAALVGCPIVAAESPAASFIIHPGENGFTSDPDTPMAFAEQVMRIIETPGLRESIRLFRYEAEKINAKSEISYWPSLGEIWKIAATQEVNIETNSLEKYASELVHTLEYTRKYTRELKKEVKKDVLQVEQKINQARIKAIRKPTSPFRDAESDGTAVFDVDAIIKN